MKKLPILFIFLNFIFISCTQKNHESDYESKTELDSVLDELAKELEEKPKVEPKWIVQSFVDEFGDETGEKFVGSEITGTFSNSATTNSKLSVYMRIGSLGVEELLLWEYGSYRVKGDKILRLKVRDEQGNDYSFRYRGDDQGLFINTPIYGGLESEVMDSLLINNKILKCSGKMEDEYSTYRFDIDCNGFIDAFNSIVDSLVYIKNNEK